MYLVKPDNYGKLVYWAEDTNQGWKCLCGYLLGAVVHGIYFSSVTYIVTYGDSLSTTVIRHIDEYYLNKRDAWASIAEKENNQ